MEKTVSNTKFLKNILGFSLPIFIGAFFSVISIPIATRIFEPSELGKINLFVIYSGVFTCLGSLGFDQAYVRFFHEPPNGVTSNVLLGWSLIISGVITAFESILIFFIRDKISMNILGANSSYLIMCLIGYVISSIFLSYAALNYRMRENALMYSIAYLFSVINIKFIFLFSLFLKPMAINAIYIMSIGQCLCAVTMFFLLRQEVDFSEKLRVNALLQLAMFSLPLAPAMLLAMLNNSISQLIINKYLSYSMVGIYSSAVSIAGLISLVQGGFNTYWTAFVWKNYKTEQHRIQMVHHLITFIMITSALFIILSQDFIYYFLGSNYRASKIFFPFLIISPIAYTISETTGLGIGISKKTYIHLFITSLTILINIGLCILLIPKFSLIGAALSSSISALARLFMFTLIGEKYYTCVNNPLKLCLGVGVLFTSAICNVLFFNVALIKYILITIFIFVTYLLYRTQANYILFFLRGLILQKLVK